MAGLWLERRAAQTERPREPHQRAIVVRVAVVLDQEVVAVQLRVLAGSWKSRTLIRLRLAMGGVRPVVGWWMKSGLKGVPSPPFA
ncbi:MAG: hypothetical protein HS113_00795 [Verrucomicrobiales bacterium]|nr:hypothetical protein [Verrucomicrobiales bacterium]